MTEIIRYGNTNTFLIRGQTANILVDTDYAGTLPAFYKAIKQHKVTVSDISYLIATHYHPDHIGLISILMEQGIKLILMESQSDSVHYSDRIFAKQSALNYKPINEKEAAILSFNESRSFFKSLGISGEIISTPSHSADSISIILDDGTCIAGDLEPYEFLDAYDENPALKTDWQKIMSYSPKIVYYSHAKTKQF